MMNIETDIDDVTSPEACPVAAGPAGGAICRLRYTSRRPWRAQMDIGVGNASPASQHVFSSHGVQLGLLTSAAIS